MKSFFVIFSLFCFHLMIIAQDAPPKHFRMGDYEVHYFTETYVPYKSRNIKFGNGGEWKTTYIDEKITLHPDHSYEYKLIETPRRIHGPGTIIYSFGSWSYKDRVFYLNSIQDTLELTKKWREKQRRAYNPVYLFEIMEPYKFKVMKDEKLYNHQNCMVSWEEDICSSVVMRYNIDHIEDFDDFLYSFLNDSTFREERISNCCTMIEIESPEPKFEAIITCPAGEDYPTYTSYPVSHIYKSLEETPFSPTKLPQGYITVKDPISAWQARECSCTFMSKDYDLLFIMMFSCESAHEWYLEWISTYF